VEEFFCFLSLVCVIQVITNTLMKREEIRDLVIRAILNTEDLSNVVDILFNEVGDEEKES
jgi:hypothetical protein